jgi:hypothetical protein
MWKDSQMKKDLFKEKIIIPLLSLKPRYINEQDFLALIFHTESRIISTYFVKEKFTLPGLFLVNDAFPTTAGDTFRQLKRREYLMARVDDTLPNVVHVDIKGRVFLLNKKEWKSIQKYLQLREGNEPI